MPELPEVEHARRMLELWIDHTRITKVTVQDARILDLHVRPAKVISALEGRRVERLERRGKWLRIALDEGALFSHLGMTGKWVKASPAAETLRLWHPLDARDDEIEHWRDEILRRQIRQPFKQAYREHYVVTPAERESRTSSARPP